MTSLTITIIIITIIIITSINELESKVIAHLQDRHKMHNHLLFDIFHHSHSSNCQLVATDQLSLALNNQTTLIQFVAGPFF